MVKYVTNFQLLRMLKEEYLKQGSEVSMKTGASLPLVLYVKTGYDKIEIKNHKYPEDGAGNNKSMKKLFPSNVIDLILNNRNERVEQLEEIIKNRVAEDI